MARSRESGAAVPAPGMRARAAASRAIGGARLPPPPPAPPPAPRMRRAPPGRVPGACVTRPRARRPPARARSLSPLLAAGDSGTGHLGDPPGRVSGALGQRRGRCAASDNPIPPTTLPGGGPARPDPAAPTGERVRREEEEAAAAAAHTPAQAPDEAAAARDGVRRPLPLRGHFRVAGGRAGPRGKAPAAPPASARPRRRPLPEGGRRDPPPPPTPPPYVVGWPYVRRRGRAARRAGPRRPAAERGSERGPGAGRQVSPCICAAPGLHGAGSALRAVAADSLGRVLVLGRE